MAARRPKDIGTAAESAVVAFLRIAGFPHAERAALAGSADRGDITGTPGIAWEVKAGAAARAEQAARVEAWLAQTEAERVHAGADVGVLVMVRAGYGVARVGWWWAVMADEPLVAGRPGAPAWRSLADACLRLRAGGYGTPLALVAPAGGARIEQRVAGPLGSPIRGPRAGEPRS